MHVVLIPAEKRGNERDITSASLPHFETPKKKTEGKQRPFPSVSVQHRGCRSGADRVSSSSFPAWSCFGKSADIDIHADAHADAHDDTHEDARDGFAEEEAGEEEDATQKTSRVDVYTTKSISVTTSPLTRLVLYRPLVGLLGVGIGQFSAVDEHP